MAKISNPIRVDIATRSITVMTKTFADKAFRFGTQEYEMLRAARNDYPDFVVKVRQIRKNSNQEHYKGLTIDYMRYYIEMHDTSVSDEFEQMVDIAKCHSVCKRYPTIKSWFLDHFPEVAKFGLSEAQLAAYEANRAAEAVVVNAPVLDCEVA